MNFDIGDTVVHGIGIMSLWENSYHHEKFVNGLHFSTVQSADENRFSIDPNVHVSAFNGAFSPDHVKKAIFTQRYGESLNDEKVLNWTTNKTNIIAYMESKFQDRLNKSESDTEDLISKAKHQIEMLQNKIMRLEKNGKRHLVHDITDREFIELRIRAIRNKLGI